MNQNDLVKCEICLKHYKAISTSHLKMHNMTFIEYKKLFPGAQIKCNNLLEKMRYNNLGKKFSEEHKRKISSSNKGKIVSEETRKKMSENHADVSGSKNPMYGLVGELSPTHGLKRTEEFKTNLSTKLTNRIFSKNHKEKLSLFRKGKTHVDIMGKKNAELFKEKMSIKMSGLNNPMSKVSVLDIWKQKYGEEKASEMWEKRRQHFSNKFSGSGNPMYGKPRPGGNFTFYKNIWFKSTWEAMLAYEMDLQGIKWEYEKFRICVKLGETYCPDFIIYDVTGKIVKIVEVKGYKNGSEKLPELLQTCCRIHVEIYDNEKMKELDIFRHSHLIQKTSKNVAEIKRK